jgi:hypothetical protein
LQGTESSVEQGGAVMRRMRLKSSLILITVAAISIAVEISVFPRDRSALALAPRAAEQVFCGKTNFQLRSRTVSVKYEYTVDLHSHRSKLSICAADAGTDVVPFDYEPEVGQQFLTAVYPRRFGTLGELLCTEWDYGASAVNLIIYHLSSNGKIEPVFNERCRFGFEVLDLSGSDVPNISGGYGDLDGAKTMRVYGWDGKKFELRESISVAAPHSYAIVTESAVDHAVRKTQPEKK